MNCDPEVKAEINLSFPKLLLAMDFLTATERKLNHHLSSTHPSSHSPSIHSSPHLPIPTHPLVCLLAISSSVQPSVHPPIFFLFSDTENLLPYKKAYRASDLIFYVKEMKAAVWEGLEERYPSACPALQWVTFDA